MGSWDYQGTWVLLDNETPGDDGCNGYSQGYFNSCMLGDDTWESRASAVLTTRVCMRRANMRLEPIIKEHAYYLSPEEDHLGGENLYSIIVRESFGFGRNKDCPTMIQISDLKSSGHDCLSWDMVRLAKELGLPLPDEVIAGYVRGVKNHVAQLREGIKECASRFNLGVGWIAQEEQQIIKNYGDVIS